MKIPPYTKQHEDIIYYLYQFRYLLVNQLIKLFGHNDKKWIQQLLNYLVGKRFIAQIKNEEISKGFVYCLDTKAGHILKKGDGIDKAFLDRLYKEKKKEAPFIKEQLFIADIYLFFFGKKEKGQELNFFTKQELGSYKYFPDPLPSAYIEEIDGADTNRYFLDYFDEYTPHKVITERVIYYLDYCRSGDWQVNTDNASFPSVLFVLPSEKRKYHIKKYSQAILAKNLGDDIDLFLTTRNEIKTGEVNWEEIKPEE